MATISELVNEQSQTHHLIKQTVYLECYLIAKQNSAFEAADEIRIILITNFGMEFDVEGNPILTGG